MRASEVVGIVLVVGGLFWTDVSWFWIPVGLGVLILLFGQEFNSPVSDSLSFASPPTISYKAWCSHCEKYVSRKHGIGTMHVWEIPCPECGHKDMTFLSPKDREAQ